MTHNGKKNTKKIWRIQKLSLPLHRKQQKMVQTYGAMVAQQILVLLVEVRILIGLQALRQKWRRAFFVLIIFFYRYQKYQNVNRYDKGK